MTGERTMKKATTHNKAMEDALQAAVARIGNGHGSGSDQMASSPMADPIGLLMSVLPKLLEGRGGNQEDVNEKLEALQKDDLAPIRQQMKAQGELLRRVFRAQKILLRELRAVQSVQSALGSVVSNMASQLEVIDDGAADEGLYHDLNHSRGFEEPLPRVQRSRKR